MHDGCLLDYSALSWPEVCLVITLTLVPHVGKPSVALGVGASKILGTRNLV